MAARITRIAWSAWRYRVQYARVARKALGRLAFRVQHGVLMQWREHAQIMGQKRDKVGRVASQIKVWG